MKILMILSIILVSLMSFCASYRSPPTRTRRTVLRTSASADDSDGEDFSRGYIPTGKGISRGGSETNKNSALARMANGEALPPYGLDKKPLTPRAKHYVDLVESLTPNEMLVKFTQKSPENVQEAAKSTVMTILGTLPNYALDAALITTSSKLANLIYQMQLTGYMLKNAEYRMSLTRSLKGLPKLPVSTVIQKGNFSASVGNPEQVSIQGEVTITDKVSGAQATIDADEITLALSKEVEALRAELGQLRGEREKELQSNLLTYVQALPEQEMVKLSSGMSEDVMDAFATLVDSLLNKLNISREGPEVAVQQSMGALAQLCMWQLTVGYTLRERESFETGTYFDE